jgi:hypothetical protein
MSLEISLKQKLGDIKNKKNQVISEGKYTINRFSKIFEDVNLDNNDDLLILRANLIKEFKTLYKNHLLNENVDMSSIGSSIGYLAKKLSKSVWDRMFIGLYKEMAKSLGFNPESVMFTVVVEGFQMMEWGDIIKVLGGDCDLLTRKLTSAILSGLTKKISDKMQLAGAGYDIIRIALVQGLTDDPDSPVGKMVQQNLSPVVCKKMEEWLGKVEKKGEQIQKDKESSKKEPSTPTTKSTPDVFAQAKKATGL